ncbi:hypothetical protein B6U99_00275 [Candidatus Geothermarchaeota archaeon ex4572_27]|nr:MAG: hypothetical protein B6U99_00275 [Candidatus Geothermarchaeota archaeon ex4572_27]
MLRPVRMKKFTLAVLQRDEDMVTNLLGQLGVVELSKERAEVGREVEEVEDFNRHLRNYERTRGLLSTIASYIAATKKEREALPEPLPLAAVSSEIMSREEIKKFIDEFEETVNKYASEADTLTRRLDEIRRLLKDLQYFEKHRISLDMPGDYTHIFVKAGFVPTVNIEKMKRFLEPFDVVYSILEGRPGENLVIVAGSNKDRKEIERALTLVNFDEFVPPKDARPDPSEEIKRLREEESGILARLRELYNEIVDYLNKTAEKTRYISFLRSAKSAILRTRTLTIMDGWVPADRAEELRRVVEEKTGGRALINVRDPEEHEEPPTYLKHPGILGKLNFLTLKQGVPRYTEVDPTPIYVALFAVMYGMMFGDFGQGCILLALGLVFILLRKPFLGFTASGVVKLGTLICVSGASAIVFGILYGECFLFHVIKPPIWLDPIEDIMEIIVIALIFGIIQIIIGDVLYVINNIMSGEILHAIFGWKGLFGLIYYVLGIYLAIKFVEGGSSLSVFVRPDVLPLTVAAIVLVGVVIPASPTIINFIEKRGETFGYTFMMGFAELIEAFISYLTNTLSYIRIAAFAVGHAALAEMARVLSASMGVLPAYVLINILVILLEGFVVAVQSLRLVSHLFTARPYS